MSIRCCSPRPCCVRRWIVWGRLYDAPDPRYPQNRHIPARAHGAALRPFAAVLGDYGIGKTFLCRMFTRELLERRKTDPSLPFPLYLDLRDIPTWQDGRAPHLEEMLEALIGRSGVKNLQPEILLEKARRGEWLLIFDGLDEKTVHYTPAQASEFIRQIQRVLPSPAGGGVGGEGAISPPVRRPDQAAPAPLLNLSHANFTQADLRENRFEQIRLDHARFTAAKLDHAAFQHCSLTNADLAQASLIATTFRHCALTQSRWQPAGDHYRAQALACLDEPAGLLTRGLNHHIQHTRPPALPPSPGIRLRPRVSPTPRTVRAWLRRLMTARCGSGR